MVEYVDSEQKVDPQNSNEEMRSSIKVKRRQGIQIRTHISGTGDMKARYFNQQVVKKADKVFFEVDLENIGTLFYRGNFWLDIFDEQGQAVDKVTLSEKSIYPGCSARFSADISGLKNGKYTVLCVYDTQSNKVFGGKYQIAIP